LNVVNIEAFVSLEQLRGRDASACRAWRQCPERRCLAERPVGGGLQPPGFATAASQGAGLVSAASWVQARQARRALASRPREEGL